LEELFQENIFRPLGIGSGTFWPDHNPELKARSVPITYRDEETGRVMEKQGAATLSTGVTECFGGQGLFMAAEDYVKVLHSLLVDDELLLKKKTAALMFQPQLTPPSKTKLLELMEDPSWAVGDFPKTAEYDWGLGGILIDGNSHEYRKRGTLIWSGAANPFWVSILFLHNCIS
jgi:CubicO group peptidase (beta-lactamase class C family)